MGIIFYLYELALDMMLAAIPAVGFAMVFNVPQRALRWCALLGAIGHGSRMVMMTAGFNIEWATFMAALLVGSIGIQWSHWYPRPLAVSQASARLANRAAGSPAALLPERPLCYYVCSYPSLFSCSELRLIYVFTNINYRF